MSEATDSTKLLMAGGDVVLTSDLWDSYRRAILKTRSKSNQRSRALLQTDINVFFYHARLSVSFFLFSFATQLTQNVI